MIHARHPDVAMMIMHCLTHEAQGPNVRAVADAVRSLTGVEGFEPPSWEALLEGARPPPRDPEDHEPGGTRGGWQHEAASRVERNFRDRRLMPVMSRSDKLCCAHKSVRLRASLSLSVHVCVDVAVCLIVLAIIAPRVPEHGCWEDGVTLLRALQPEFAAKLALV